MKITNKDTKIGYQGESYSREIEFEVENELLDCDIYFEFKKPDGKLYVSEKINAQEKYLMPYALLDSVGFLTIQMVAYRGGDFVKKSEPETFYIAKSLNAVDVLLTDEGNRGFVKEIIAIAKELGAKLSVDENGVISLLNKDGEIVSQIDLPTEKIIKNVYYDDSSNSLVFEFENANSVYVPMATSIDKNTNIEVNKLNAYGDVKVGHFGKTTSGSTRPLYTTSRKGLQVNGSAKVRSLEIGFTKEVDENGNEIVYPDTSASGGELKVYGTTNFYEYVRIRNSAKIDGALQVGGEFKIGGTFNVNGYDVENVSSIEVDQTSKLLGDTFSDKFKPYNDKQGKLGSDTKRFAYGYIGEIVLDNHHVDEQGNTIDPKVSVGTNVKDTYIRTYGGNERILESHEFREENNGMVVIVTSDFHYTTYNSLSQKYDYIYFPQGSYYNSLKNSNYYYFSKDTYFKIVQSNYPYNLTIDNFVEIQESEVVREKCLNITTPENGKVLHNGKELGGDNTEFDEITVRRIMDNSDMSSIELEGGSRKGSVLLYAGGNEGSASISITGSASSGSGDISLSGFTSVSGTLSVNSKRVLTVDDLGDIEAILDRLNGEV